MIKMRIPTDKEWEKVLEIAAENGKFPKEDDMQCLVTHTTAGEICPAGSYMGCGGISPRYWVGYSWSYRACTLGFLPVFEGLPIDLAEARDGCVVTVGTLYMDGKPVRVPQNPSWRGDIEAYIPGVKLTLGPAAEDPAYVLQAVVIGGICVADRVMLNNISCDDIRMAL